MLSSTNVKNSCDIETTNQLFNQLSISFDNNKFIKHKNASSRPKLKRLLKIKYSSSFNSTSAFCSRCKREAFINPKHDHSTPEKEVQVEKESLQQLKKKVIFSAFSFNDEEKKDENLEKLVNSSSDCQDQDDEQFDDQSVSEPAPAFQSVFFARRPSIIGNNEFWLPHYSSPTEANGERKSSTVDDEIEEATSLQENLVGDDDKFASSNEVLSDQCHVDGLTGFFKSIFHATAKQGVKVLKVVELIDGTLAALTEEHFFHCRQESGSYRMLDVTALKDVHRILVNEDCTMMVMEIDRQSNLNEHKEFVPGYSEKTESLVSRMVYALSRIKNFLPDVIRLPIQLLPTCTNIATWLEKQNEGVEYAGIVNAENISFLDHELLDENFMIKTGKHDQFHPVRIMLRAGYIVSVCNGGCESNNCKYTLSVELKNEITRIKRENHPWPNSFRISTENDDFLLSSSSMAGVNDLLEKIYFVLQCKKENSSKQHALVFVTQFFLQLFSMSQEKNFLSGFPLLNLDIKGDQDDYICTIDSEGFEAEDIDDVLPMQNRWKLEFLSLDEKVKFLAATSKRLV